MTLEESCVLLSKQNSMNLKESCVLLRQIFLVLDDLRYTRDILSCLVHIILRCNWRSGPPPWVLPCAFCWSAWHGHAWPHPVAQQFAYPLYQHQSQPTDRPHSAHTRSLQHPNCHCHHDALSMYTLLPLLPDHWTPGLSVLPYGYRLRWFFWS